MGDFGMEQRNETNAIKQKISRAKDTCLTITYQEIEGDVFNMFKKINKVTGRHKKELQKSLRITRTSLSTTRIKH